MTAATTFDTLLTLVRGLHSGSLVAIEGFMASGKSRLADDLASAASLSVVHLDAFVEPGLPEVAYVDRLGLAAIERELARNLGHTVLVEGICLQEVLQRLGLAPDLNIYVKRVSALGIWNDGFDLEDYEAGTLSLPGEPYTSDLRYHSRYRPHERVALQLLRVE